MCLIVFIVSAVRGGSLCSDWFVLQNRNPEWVVEVHISSVKVLFPARLIRPITCTFLRVLMFHSRSDGCTGRIWVHPGQTGAARDQTTCLLRPRQYISDFPHIMSNIITSVCDFSFPFLYKSQRKRMKPLQAREQLPVCLQKYFLLISTSVQR